MCRIQKTHFTPDEVTFRFTRLLQTFNHYLVGTQTKVYATSERKQDLLLESILSWRKRSERHEEVWKIAAAVKLALNKQKTLQSHLPSKPQLPPKMMRA